MISSSLDNYQPSPQILQKYAQVLINFALNSGKGVKPGEVVQIVVPDIAKALAKELRNAVLIAGGHPVVRLIPTEFDKDFYELASPEQLKFFPKKMIKSRVDLLDHSVGIIADPDPQELSGVDPKKIIMARDSAKAYRDWMIDKENHGQFTWTVGLWGVAAKAELVGLSLEAYWQQIIQACFLDQADPLAQWRKVWEAQIQTKKFLDELPIKTLKVEGTHVNLTILLGEHRRWQGGSGRNIPSFEIFTSPDWRGTNGWIKFNQPLYRYGQVIQDIKLEFKDGLVSNAQSSTGEEFLKDMITSPNANKIGEFSLTDRRLSRITHPMAETLFDENIGGPFGNTHIAIGMSYHDCYTGDPANVSKKTWKELGFNNSAEHTDMVSTTIRTATATLKDGSKKVIYADGIFLVD